MAQKTQRCVLLIKPMPAWDPRRAPAACFVGMLQASPLWSISRFCLNVGSGGVQEVLSLMQETQRCALLIKRHALSPFAAPAGLASTVQCCSLALLHCRALQASHNLALGPTLLRELWPACDQASKLLMLHPCSVGYRHL